MRRFFQKAATFFTRRERSGDQGLIPDAGQGKARLLFVHKKKQKNFIYAGPEALSPTPPQAQHDKSFCAAFFKKRLLSSREGNDQAIRACNRAPAKARKGFFL
ncbi:MAG TPA: hypothetical protein VL356_01905 [Acidocella sp.]|nr:hypothetical protein [Acidocella sp.]